MSQKIQKELVSVIIPTYNGEEFIEETLESVFSQTYKNFEVIIIDDGSSDNTRKIIKEYDKPLNHYFQQNLGAGAARNLGVARSKGEFIAFLDHDDYWTPTKLERQISVLKSKSDVDAVVGFVKNVAQKDWHSIKKDNSTSLDNALSALIPSVMFLRRDAFSKVGEFETKTKIGEVIDWFVRAKENGLNIASLDEILVFRRIHNTNNGILHKDFKKDYLRVLKRSIDRRRAAKEI